MVRAVRVTRFEVRLGSLLVTSQAKDGAAFVGREAVQPTATGPAVVVGRGVHSSLHGRRGFGFAGWIDGFKQVSLNLLTF